MIAMPLNLLPCREALLEVVDVWFHNSHHRSDEATIHREKEKCCWRLFHRYNSYETVEDAEITTEDELLFEVLSMTTAEGQEGQDECLHTSTIIRHDPIQEDYIFRNTVAHYGGTLLITASAYLGAVAVSGVAAVWSFIGSSMVSIALLFCVHSVSVPEARMAFIVKSRVWINVQDLSLDSFLDN